MPTTTNKPSTYQSTTSATLNLPKLNFKTRPANEPFDPVDHMPDGYSKLSPPKIIANPVASFKADVQNISKKEYNTAPHYIKKIKRKLVYDYLILQTGKVIIINFESLCH
jgi:hypothetical protein